MIVYCVNECSRICILPNCSDVRVSCIEVDGLTKCEVMPGTRRDFVSLPRRDMSGVLFADKSHVTRLASSARAEIAVAECLFDDAGSKLTASSSHRRKFYDVPFYSSYKFDGVHESIRLSCPSIVRSKEVYTLRHRKFVSGFHRTLYAICIHTIRLWIHSDLG